MIDRPCAGRTSLWTSDDVDDQAVAKSGCGRCPIAGKCLARAFGRREPVGVWGGFAPADRDALVAALKRKVADG